MSNGMDSRQLEAFAATIRKGTRVFWTDPTGANSGPGKVVKAFNDDTDSEPFVVDDETILTIYLDAGGKVGCTIAELIPA